MDYFVDFNLRLKGEKVVGTFEISLIIAFQAVMYGGLSLQKDVDLWAQSPYHFAFASCYIVESNRSCSWCSLPIESISNDDSNGKMMSCTRCWTVCAKLSSMLHFYWELVKTRSNLFLRHVLCFAQMLQMVRSRVWPTNSMIPIYY